MTITKQTSNYVFFTNDASMDNKYNMHDVGNLKIKNVKNIQLRFVIECVALDLKRRLTVHGNSHIM